MVGNDREEFECADDKSFFIDGSFSKHALGTSFAKSRRVVRCSAFADGLQVFLCKVIKVLEISFETFLFLKFERREDDASSIFVDVTNFEKFFFIVGSFSPVQYGPFVLEASTWNVKPRNGIEPLLLKQNKRQANNNLRPSATSLHHHHKP